MTPAVGEAVVVTEPFGRAQTQLTQSNRAGVITEPGATRVDDAVLAALDHEPMQMLTAPPERGLQDGAQPGDRGVGRS